MAWTLRPAGWQEGYYYSDAELIEETQSVRRLLMEFGGGHYLPDAFHNLSELAEDCRLLIAQRLDGSGAIDGCVAYTLVRCICEDPLTGEQISRRINVLRLLGVRECPQRPKLALHLGLEAMLRGTIRSRYDNDDEPHVLGTLGVVMEPNERALKWAANLGFGVEILRPEAHIVEIDPILRTLRDYAAWKHAQLKLDQSYQIVVPNRSLLQEAALLNLIGREFDQSGAEFAVHYDLTDPYSREIEVAVANIVNGNPVTLARLGLAGDRGATIWGPPEAPGMRIGGIGGVVGWEDFAK